jgi:agmatine deiminase
MTVFVPPEWAPHKAIWLGFPSDPDLWLENLGPAQDEVEALARALAGPGRERVRMLVSGEAAAAEAHRRLSGVDGVEIVPGRFGDIWLRDTGPIFRDGGADGFQFNGWGGKYILDGDDTVAPQIARRAGVALHAWPFILEGGAIDHDGEGTVLTTRQCLLNPNRNKGWTKSLAEAALAQALAARKVLWLGEGLANDHTDGHVDNLGRFIAPATVACPAACGDDDPNRAAYDAAASDLAAMSDADGRPLSVVRIPSPGLLPDDEGRAIPASHMNFIIANGAVIMPDYGSASAPAALEALRPHFPGREMIRLPSSAILTGGGSFHCITQQEPA